MDNDQSSNLTPPLQTTSLTPEQISGIRASNKKKLIWGLICLIGPTALFLITMLVYVVMNFTAGSVSGDYTNAQTSENSGLGWQQVGNVIIFLVGAVVTLTWLPGIITGIILISKRQRI